MSDDSSKNKDDSLESSSDSDDPSFGPAALGLQRVGSAPPKRKKTTPLQKLNARGRPARIRKKNSKYDDEMEEGKTPTKGSPTKKPAPKTPSTPVKPSPVKSSVKKRGPKKRTQKESEDDTEDEEEDEEEEAAAGAASEAESKISEAEVAPAPKPKPKPGRKRVLKTSTITESMHMTTIDKKACQRIGLRLRNLLKLPKAHKFVMYEFFYSNIDRAVFHGTNDFEMCLVETFPRLKTRLMTKVEWNKVRQTFGKPRRCSAKFFEEERVELERKRQKIRLLQSRKAGDASFVCDLPSEIPVPFTIGTKVTARLRNPQDGLFTGSIEGLVHKSHSYRITFERQGIGSQEIPDYEVMSAENVDAINVSKITKEFLSRPDISYYMVSPLKPGLFNLNFYKILTDEFPSVFSRRVLIVSKSRNEFSSRRSNVVSKQHHR